MWFWRTLIGRRPLVYPPLPVSVPGVIAWYDASLLTVANGASVGSLPDLTGNGYHARSAVSSQRPTFVANAVNSLGALHFDPAAQQRLKLAKQLSFPTAAEVWGVWYLEEPTPNPGPVLYNFNSNATEGYVVEVIYEPNAVVPGAQLTARGQDTVAQRNSNLIGVQTGAAKVLGYTSAEGGTIQIHSGNTDGPTVAIGTFASTSGINMGHIMANRDGLSRWGRGYLCELFIANITWSGAERTAVKSYFSTKWGATL